MIKGILKVEFEKELDKENPFYGKRTVKSTLKEVTTYEKYEGVDIAPCDVYCKAKLSDGTICTIEVDKYRLEHIDENYWEDVFALGNEVFCLTIWFDENGKIEDALLEEWFGYSFYENAEEADMQYHGEDLMVKENESEL